METENIKEIPNKKNETSYLKYGKYGKNVTKKINRSIAKLRKNGGII
jgi:hypothetical protein